MFCRDMVELVLVVLRVVLNFFLLTICKAEALPIDDKYIVLQAMVSIIG